MTERLTPEREHVEQALAQTGAARDSLLALFSEADGRALAAMLREAAEAYTGAVMALGPTPEAVRAAQPQRLRLDTLQWMFDACARAAADRARQPG